MARNENAALRLAHPTVVPGAIEDDEGERESVDVTGTHPTVRATRTCGD